mmetsp:Transcript_23869/g.42255  ORF Transcript_23869/g.42255 Transcript_23869/m.42255 type:complete len:257 (-) Transcript_23869:16-786(-)
MERSERAGISLPDVRKLLVDCYLHQVNTSTAEQPGGRKASQLKLRIHLWRADKVLWYFSQNLRFKPTPLQGKRLWDYYHSDRLRDNASIFQAKECHAIMEEFLEYNKGLKASPPKKALKFKLTDFTNFNWTRFNYKGEIMFVFRLMYTVVNCIVLSQEILGKRICSLVPLTMVRIRLQAIRLSIRRLFELQMNVRAGSFKAGIDKEWPPSRVTGYYKEKPLCARIFHEMDRLTEAHYEAKGINIDLRIKGAHKKSK